MAVLKKQKTRAAKQHEDPSESCKAWDAQAVKGRGGGQGRVKQCLDYFLKKQECVHVQRADPLHNPVQAARREIICEQ